MKLYLYLTYMVGPGCG